MRILIISYYFPPLNSIASIRPYSWARAWTDLGHKVHVLTTAKMPFDGPCDLDLDVSGIECDTVRYLPRFSQHARSRDPARESHRWERIKRMTRSWRLGLGIFADLRTLALRPLLRRGRKLVRQHRFDFIISSYLPGVAHIMASRLAREFGIPWIADYRDLWHLDHTGQAYRFTSLASGWIERRVVSQAAMFSTVSRGLAAELARRFPQPVVVCYNGYLPPPAGTEPPSVPPEYLRLVHIGRLNLGKRDPEPLLSVLAELEQYNPSQAARICVEFYGEIEPWLEARVRAHGLGHLVRFVGQVSYIESIRAQRSATALLLFDWSGGRLEGVLSGKLMEYLGSGRPILVIGGPGNSEAAAIVRRCGAGVFLAGAREIHGWLASADTRALEGWKPDVQEVAVFSRRHQAEQLLAEIVARVLALDAHPGDMEGHRTDAAPAR